MTSTGIYDWIMIIYIIIGIISLIWASIGNNYVFNKIDKKKNLHDSRKHKCDIYFDEMRKSWLPEQNIWKSVEYFLMGLSYLSMVITIYITVDGIVDIKILPLKITFYTIINLLSSAIKDYLTPEKKAMGIRKAYLILNEAILDYEYGFIELDDLNKAVKKEKI